MKNENHYIYTFDEKQLDLFLYDIDGPYDRELKNKLTKEEKLAMAIEQLKNDEHSSWNKQ